MAITFEFKIKQLEVAPILEAYKPFEELTEPNVISWLEKVADKPHMQERITKAIQAQIAPKNVDIPLPWAPVEELESKI